MEMPNYKGLIEPWKIELITQRAKRHGFRDDELPDVLQEVVLELLTFKYDPNHANGADERTVLRAVIDNQLCKMIRKNCRYRLHVEQAALLASIFSTEDVRPQCIDIQDAIKMLPPRDQQVCHGLARGMSRDQLAHEIGCSWHTVNNSCKRIRQHFMELGLDGWIDE